MYIHNLGCNLEQQIVMRKNIRSCIHVIYVEMDNISIFYDTIFCFGGIYSRGWYLAKRNIAICQIKETVVAQQQQLHLKGCDVARRGFLRFGVSLAEVTSHRYTDYIVLYCILTRRQLSGTWDRLKSHEFTKLRSRKVWRKKKGNCGRDWTRATTGEELCRLACEIVSWTIKLTRITF